MTHDEQFQKLLNVKITEDWDSDAELQIYTQSTADGYQVYIITNDPKELDWENDVYHSEPSFDDIIDRIKEIESYDNEPPIIYCSDFEEFFNEYEIEDYIEQHEDEEDDE